MATKSNKIKELYYLYMKMHFKSIHYNTLIIRMIEFKLLQHDFIFFHHELSAEMKVAVLFSKP
jgi:hypothetical protein